MVTDSAVYQRMFISRAEKEDVSPHGSSIQEIFQRRNKRDEKIRSEMISKFGFEYVNSGSQLSQKRLRGYDGKFLYTFEIITEGIDNSEEKRERAQRYVTKVYIKKAGAKERLTEPCDLEIALLEEKFTKIK